MADYTMYGLPELRKLSKANFLKIQKLKTLNETIDISLELSLAREQDVAIRNALAIKQEKEVILHLPARPAPKGVIGASPIPRNGWRSWEFPRHPTWITEESPERITS